MTKNSSSTSSRTATHESSAIAARPSLSVTTGQTSSSSVERGKLHVRNSMKWRPIKTAPKDGGLIFGYGKGRVGIAWFSLLEGWMLLSEGEDSPWETLTHWLPIPESPEEE